VTHRGPFQPLTLCDSVIRYFVRTGINEENTLLIDVE